MRGLWIVPVAAILVTPSAVCADGGTVQLSERSDGRLVTVFTRPAPCRAGPVDVSVLLQDAAGRPVTEANVIVRATPTGKSGPAVVAAAGIGGGTNQLLYEAVFDVPAPGTWQIDLTVDGRPGPAFDLEVLEPLPPWEEFAGWVGWPTGAVVLFAAHQALARRRST